MAPPKPEATNSNECSIKVGTTGTIGSLMSQELEAMKEAPQANSHTQKKPQSVPVSMPCGFTPRKSQSSRNSTNESSSSNSNTNGSPGCKNTTNGHKTRHNLHKNGHRAPILGTEDITIDNNRHKEAKKPSSYIVEVVDLKCNNPMSSRLKKLGFSKLSESTA